MSPAFRFVVKWARTVHLYLTLFALGLLLFFAVTGFMLNHEDWFYKPQSVPIPCKVPLKLLEQPEQHELEIVELLRSEYAVSGALVAYKDEFAEPGDKQPLLDIKPEVVRATFKRPGRITTAEVYREETRLNDTQTFAAGEGVVTVVDTGGNGVLMELHKAKDASLPWRVVLDFVAVVYVVVSVTGIIMWWSLKGRGKFGLWVAVAGVVLSVAVVVVFELMRK